MAETRWRRMFDVFADALERIPEERESYLVAACGQDAELRREIDELLAAHAAGTGPLDQPLHEAATVTTRPFAEAWREAPLDAEGTEIGPYRLVRKLGEGGMGVVYEAEQRGVLSRRVALKLVKLGMDTRELVARFALERRTLALLEHPNIARVYDAGATAAGRPYFVMELVEGRRIDHDCDARRLGVEERVSLVASLCRALEHAHRRGVLHRDIKPSNVLVAEEGGRGLPKIIDFGIAKLVAGASEPGSLLTRDGGLIGTPEYMSPEQAEGRGDLDTRTDVYSLGVLLYQLVAGTLPFASERLRSGPLEARRILTQEEVPAPEGRFAALGGESAEVAARRATEPRALRRVLAGELRWILARATEKDRERRYGSAAELAADLERYLRGEALLAGPPGRLYQLRKLAGRHRAAVGTGLAVLVSLSAGLVATSLALREANAARGEAERHAAVAEAVSEFLNADLLGAGAPHRPGDRELSVRELLDRTAARLEDAFEGPPAVEAGVRNSLADAYWGLGLGEVSVTQRAAAVEILRRERGPDDEETLRSSMEWGVSLRDLGRLDEAGSIVANALPAAERALGPRHGTTIRLRRLEGMLAQSRGELEQAESLFSGALEQARAAGSDTLLVATLTNDLVTVAERLGRPGRVERARSVHAAYRDHYGDDHDLTVLALRNLALTLAREESLDVAEPLLRSVLDSHLRILGPEHPQTVMDRIALSGLLRRKGELPDARRLAEEAWAASPAALGERSFEALQVRTNLARVLRDQGELEPAAEHMAGVVRTARQDLGERHDLTGRFVLDLGQILAELDRRDEAEAALLEAHRLLLAALGPDHESVAEAAQALAGLYDREGATEQARRWREGPAPE